MKTMPSESYKVTQTTAGEFQVWKGYTHMGEWRKTRKIATFEEKEDAQAYVAWMHFNG